MEKSDNPVLETELQTLRLGIRDKYREYHLLNRDRFPEFAYNTNRANYEPLRLSFEEEFYVVRGLDRTTNTIHIPSTNTLTLIFCDDAYAPGKKILNTCRSYLAGAATVTVGAVVPAVPQPNATPVKTRRLLLAGLIGAAGLLGYGGIVLRSASPPGGLIIFHPYHGQTVPQQTFAEGRVSDADTVWLVVRPAEGVRYWVQPPVKVDNNNRWRGRLYIGSVDKGDVGFRYQLRAFVNPAKLVKEEEILYSWPEAELSSDVVEVVRGPANE